jgi:hypothetical protein
MFFREKTHREGDMEERKISPIQNRSKAFEG